MGEFFLMILGFGDFILAIFLAICHGRVLPHNTRLWRFYLAILFWRFSWRFAMGEFFLMILGFGDLIWRFDFGDFADFC
jgi:hypothetical protein